MKQVVIQLFLMFLFPMLMLGADRTNLSGTVQDEQGAPITGASVVLKGTSLGTYTDSDGGFLIRNIRVQVYTIEVSHLGYHTSQKKINLDETNSLSVTLKEKSIKSEAVIIKATRASKNAPFAIDNIDEAAIEEGTGEEIPYLLNISPSVVPYSENGTPLGNTAFRVRGTDPSRLNVTVNGIPLNDAESQTVFWVNMSDFAESTESMQLQRGVGTSTNGAAAFGASLNLQTKTYTENPEAKISSAVGSFNTFKNSAMVSSGLINNKFAFDARISKVLSDGYIEHSGLDHNSMYLSGGYFGEKTMLKAIVWRNEEHTQISWWGVPSDSIETNRTFNPAGVYYDENGNKKYYDDQADNYTQTHFQLHFSRDISKDLVLNLAGHYTKGAGYYEQYQDDANWLHDSYFSQYGLSNLYYLNPRDSSTVYQSDLIRQRWLDNDFYGGTMSLNYKSEKLDIILGGAINRYEGKHFGEIIWAEKNPGIEKNYEYYLNNSVKSEWNFYGKVNYEVFDQFFAYGDLQYRHINYTLDGITDKQDSMNIRNTYPFFNPKIGLFYQMNRQKIYASFAIANREPTRANLKDAVDAPRSSPKPETLYDTELGYQFFARYVSLSLNAFYMQYKNQLVPTGEKSDVGYDIMTNVPVSYRAGIEVAASIKPLQSLKWSVNTTFSHNKISNFKEYLTYYLPDYWTDTAYIGHDRGSTNLAYSPNITGISLLTWYFDWNMSISLITSYVGEQYFDNTSDENAKIDDYLLNDVAIAYHIPLKNFVKMAAIKLKINNIANTDYIANAYGGKDIVGGKPTRWTYYYPQAGINYFVELNIKF